jgi:hypothetical protein
MSEEINRSNTLKQDIDYTVSLLVNMKHPDTLKDVKKM